MFTRDCFVRWRTLIYLFLLLAAGAIASAQGNAPPAGPHPPDSLPALGTAELPDWEALRLLPDAVRVEVSDECQDAIPATLTRDEPAFDASIDTGWATGGITDPVQSCTLGGSAANSNSVWVRIIAPPEDGQLTVETITKNTDRYDTVVTIYPAGAGCNSLDAGDELGCNDDVHAFQSRASALVSNREEYLVEISGWGVDNAGGHLDLSGFFGQDTHWQHLSQNELPSGLSQHVAVSDGERLYVLGGQTSTAYSEAVNVFNPATAVWSPLEAMPQSYSNTDGVYANGQIYLPSGYAGATLGQPYAGIHYTYIISQDTWSTLTPMTSLSTITEPIAWGAAAADPAGAAYYYTGGRRGSDYPNYVALAEVLQYNINSDTWQSFPPLVTPRYAHQAAFLGDELCIVGGIDEDGYILNSGECCDFRSPPSCSPIAGLNIPRFSFGSAVGPDGRWYVFGGNVGGGVTPKTEIFDPETDTWTLLNEHWSLRQSRQWPAGAQLGIHIYATGGYVDDLNKVVGTVERLTVGAAEFNYLPLIATGAETFLADRHEPNDTVTSAYGPLNANVSLTSIFDDDDTEDFFFLQTEITSTIQVTLNHIPAGGYEYDLYFYQEPKHLLALSQNYSNNDEFIRISDAPAGRYTIRVQNKSWYLPASQEPYWLLATY